MGPRVDAPSPPGINWRRYLSKSAVAGFTLSLIVHLSSIIGINVNKYVPWVWVLHIGFMILIIPILFDSFPILSPMHRMRRFLVPLPPSARQLLIGFGIYALINFGIFFLSPWAHEGSPAIREGRYVLLDQGPSGQQAIVRSISEAEYDRRTAAQLRAFSGHWMLFYLLSALYFRYVPLKKQAAS